MNDDDLVECRLCGLRWRSLGHHLRHRHQMDADEYRDRFGMRRGTPLTSLATRSRFSESIRSTIATGALDAHFVGNAKRASVAGVMANRAVRELSAKGIRPREGAPATPRAVIEAVVADVEAGALVATAVKRSPIVYSAYHAGLARHPDLKARHLKAARR